MWLNYLYLKPTCRCLCLLKNTWSLKTSETWNTDCVFEDVLQILLNHLKRHGNKPASFLFKKRHPVASWNLLMPSSLVVRWMAFRSGFHIFRTKRRDQALWSCKYLCCDASATLSGAQEAEGFMTVFCCSVVLVLFRPALADFKRTDTYPLNAELHSQLLAPNKLEVFFLSLLYVPKPVSCKVHWNL